MLSEKTIEKYLIKLCKEEGWECIKLIDQGRAGFPDRTVLKAMGDHFFVEVKREDGKVSKIQAHRIRKLRLLGHRVYVPHSKDEIDRLMGMERANG